MLNSRHLISLLSLLFTLSCNSAVKDKLGLTRNAPDEFKVISNPSLSVPPDFRLQKPGSYSPDLVKKKEENNKDIIFKSKDTIINQSTTKGDQMMKEMFGSSASDAEAKALIDKENKSAVNKEKSFFEKISDFSEGKKDEDTTDPVVDPLAERNRILEAKKSGKTIEGSESAIKEEKPENKGLINKILGQ